jgi:predicted RND superfamily exporter protein
LKHAVWRSRITEIQAIGGERDADDQSKDMSKAEIAVLLTLVFISLCVALYNAWIAPLAAFAVLLILAVAVLGYSGFK